MISVSFAPNEKLKDGLLSFCLLLTPWSWRDKKLSADLELAISKKLKVNKENILFFLTGRSAIFNILKALDLKEGDKVLAQTFTCEAVILPILALKAFPMYADIEKETFSMDLESLKARIKIGPKVIILQHTFAMEPKYREEILDLTQKNNIVVIEDLAHGFNHKITADKSTIKLLSFGRSKAFSSVWGGAVISQNKKLNIKIKKLEQELKYPTYLFIFTSLIYKPIAVFIKSTYDFLLGKILHKLLSPFLTKEITQVEKRLQFDENLNAKYPAVFAKMLLSQLEDFETVQSNRETITKFYSESLNLNYKGSLSRYPVLVKNSAQILSNLASKNVFLGDWYNNVIAPKEINPYRLGLRKGSCPNAERVASEIINLPTNISLENAQKVLNLLNR